ncbi:hypothetical protein [Xanthocytophaga flava]|uniref:hypothetical protein n=1 Tax=Xanthocytophaga flava TaxID=3048013 RepID=UPI0028D16E70|nr:hypothetical protein [Xanthocytophaga flavus]MDJ1473361.1 hypothetical protein [Xanthocytophaga flavus]
MSALKELIDQIRIHPNLVGTQSIFCLRAFFDGWTFRKKPAVEDAYIDYLFLLWIKEKLAIRSTASVSWPSMICLVNTDEYDAFFHFFELFDVFYEDAKNAVYDEVPYARVEHYNHDSVVELIAKIQLRPAMYLGQESFELFASFLRGWYLRDPEGITDWHVMQGFDRWIRIRYPYFSEEISWEKIIKYYSVGSMAGLSLFFEEYKDYCQTLKVIY